MAKSKKHYVYVLACADQTLYTGYTTNPKRREQEHQSRKGAKYTRLKRRQPCRMLMTKAFASRSEAMSCEDRFKQLTRLQKERCLRKIGVKAFTVQSSQQRVDLDLQTPFLDDC